MSEFTITLSEIVSKAEQLQELNAQFKAKTDELVTTEATLNGMWEGPAKATFDNAFHADIAQMTTFYNTIITYVNALHSIAEKYNQAEITNTEIAKARTY